MHAPRLLALTFLFAAMAAAPGHADPGDALDTGGGGVAGRYIVHAQRAMEDGKLTEASDYCDRALSLYPSFIGAHATRGQVMLFAGQYDVAIKEFTTVIAAHPEYPLIFGFRAQAYLRHHEPAPAIADSNRAMQAKVGVGSVESAHLLMVRSLAYEMLGRDADAVADFADSLKVINGNTSADWRTLELRCYNAMVVGLLQSAAESCDESISRHSRNMYAYDTRGLLDLKNHDWDRAIADFTQSLYYRPEASTSLYGRALAHRAKSETAAAAADTQAATTSEPHIAEIFVRIGIQAGTGVQIIHKT